MASYLLRLALVARCRAAWRISRCTSWRTTTARRGGFVDISVHTRQHWRRGAFLEGTAPVGRGAARAPPWAPGVGLGAAAGGPATLGWARSVAEPPRTSQAGGEDDEEQVLQQGRLLRQASEPQRREERDLRRRPRGRRAVVPRRALVLPGDRPSRRSCKSTRCAAAAADGGSAASAGGAGPGGDRSRLPPCRLCRACAHCSPTRRQPPVHSHGPVQVFVRFVSHPMCRHRPSVGYGRLSLLP